MSELKLNRRQALTGAAVAGAAVLTGAVPAAAAAAARTPEADTATPFGLGVASGDPLPDGVILWTRLVRDPFNAGPGAASGLAGRRGRALPPGGPGRRRVRPPGARPLGARRRARPGPGSGLLLPVPVRGAAQPGRAYPDRAGPVRRPGCAPPGRGQLPGLPERLLAGVQRPGRGRPRRRLPPR